MEMPQTTANRSGLSTVAKGVIAAAVLALVAVAVLAVWMFKGAAQQGPSPGEGTEEGAPISVSVVHPLPGGLDRTTTQPGTVRAFEYERIFPMVAGYLRNQKVDIGSAVKKGELLAQIDAPQLLKEQEQAAAGLAQAKAQVAQMQAHVKTAEADLQTAKILITQRKAEVRRANATVTFRKAMYTRIKELAATSSVDLRLVDEQFKEMEAAEAGKDAAEAGVETAITDVEAKKAKVTQAKADLSAADANVNFAEATLAKANVYVGFTMIRSTYNGVVTQRNFHDGDYIRAGSETGLPLLVVNRTDLMRVIVQIPDVDVPFCNVGDPVDLSITALKNVKFPGLRVSRMADSENALSRTMRVEVDVPNVNGPLRDGMYGAATIHLEKGPASALRVPSSALRYGEGVASLFVVREGKAHQVQVQVGLNNGIQAEILGGLQADDLVIAQPGNLIQDGIDVQPVLENAPPAS